MSDQPPVLHGCDQPLQTAYDVALLDLDGVVYIGLNVVDGAAERLADARRAGMALAFVTNNASRTPDEVAEHLRELDVDAAAEDVVTSAQAAARLLSDRLADGAPVFVIGGGGLIAALEDRGLRPVQSPDDDPVAVVSGFHPDLPWRVVIAGAILVRDGLPWVATNTDLTVPTARGAGPGNGVLVKAVQDFSGVDPEVAGKPQPPLFHETMLRIGGDRPLVVGDRLDTDIEGAVRAEMASLLVLTGVTGLAELVAARRGSRPTYLSRTLAGLAQTHPAPVPDDGSAFARRVGGWRADVRDGAVTVTGEGSTDDWWRAVAATAWQHLDETGDVARPDGLEVPDR